LLQTLDFSSASFLPRPNVRPFHFQAVLNPFNLSDAIVTVMYKEPFRNDYPRYVPDTNKAGPGEDAPVILGQLTETLPVLTPLVVSQAIKAGYVPITNAWGTHGEIFANVVARGRVLSTAIGIPVDRTNEVLGLALDINKRHPFAGVFSCRYVKQSGATLAFTQYPHTCILEFDSFDSPPTWQFYHAVWDALEGAGIPHTFHWGKLHNLNAERLRRSYGGKVDEWILARNKILPKEMLPVFTNQFMKDIVVDTVLSPAV
ncbi:MAG TPA: D-arabinono-1,4-lactone oxidase, partial [Flavisolibacter sp.]|nr:D-arabinono-1,4-lactone oxidase [Flavisolibacter sp.]